MIIAYAPAPPVVSKVTVFGLLSTSSKIVTTPPGRTHTIAKVASACAKLAGMPKDNLIAAPSEGVL